MNRHPTAVNKVRPHNEAFDPTVRSAHKAAIPLPGYKRQRKLGFNKQ